LAYRGQRTRRRLLACAIGLLLAGNAVAFRAIANRVAPVSVATAVERFRAQHTDAGASPAASVQTTGAAPTGGPAAAGATEVTAPPAAARVATASSPAASARPAAAAKATAPASTAAAAPQLPSPGVYVYATQGWEKLDVLGGARHDYPAQTTTTFTATSCGRDVRWDGLEQRYDIWRTCSVGAAVSLTSFTTYHSFYNQAVTKQYTCDPGTTLRPVGTAPGTKGGGTCHDGDSAAIIDATVKGIEPLAVNGVAIQTVHVLLNEQLTGSTKGTHVTELWYSTANNLIVKRTSKTDADTQTPFGYSHYSEDLTTTLADVRPQR